MLLCGSLMYVLVFERFGFYPTLISNLIQPPSAPHAANGEPGGDHCTDGECGGDERRATRGAPGRPRARAPGEKEEAGPLKKEDREYGATAHIHFAIVPTEWAARFDTKNKLQHTHFLKYCMLTPPSSCGDQKGSIRGPQCDRSSKSYSPPRYEHMFMPPFTPIPPISAHALIFGQILLAVKL